MMSENGQCCLEQEKAYKETLVVQQENEKLIADVQICIRCGKKFQFKRGRKRCPCCQGLLRNRTMILKAPLISSIS